MSIGDYLDLHKSALRWDIKRAMKGLCQKLADIGEECFIVSANPSNGIVGHMGSIRGDEYINEKSNILYDFLEYCRESDEEMEETIIESEEEGEEEAERNPDTPVVLSNPCEDKDENSKEKDAILKSKPYLTSARKCPSPKTPTETGSPKPKTETPKTASPSNRHVTAEDVKTRFKRYVFSRNVQRIKKQTAHVKDKYFCDVCSMSFKFHALYKAHLLTEEHKQTSKTYCKCYKCGVMFGGKKDVYKHILKCY